jgi:hypothetical protein
MSGFRMALLWLAVVGGGLFALMRFDATPQKHVQLRISSEFPCPNSPPQPVSKSRNRPRRRSFMELAAIDLPSTESCKRRSHISGLCDFR